MRKTRKLTVLLLAAAIILALAACGNTAGPQTEDPEKNEASEPAVTEDLKGDEPAELIVFAAASMTETLTKIAEMYKDVAPNVTLTYNFDSSGTLKTQIQEGADCDLFISAGQKQMDQLDINAGAELNTDGLDFVDSNTRINLLENRVTLCVPEGNPKEIRSFGDLAERLKAGDILFAMGNADVPVGQYTQKILAYYELSEDGLAGKGVITYGSNVKEVSTQIKQASVDCGVVYCTDAFSAGLEIVDYAARDMCGQVIYPAAVLKTAGQADAAKAFLDYLTGSDAMAVFEEAGFAPVR